MADEKSLEHDPDQVAAEHPAMGPVPVKGEVALIGRVYTSEEPADLGTYRSIVLLGTEDKQMILSQDNHRVRAWVLVTGTGPVYIGSEAQCAQVKGSGAAANLSAGPALVPANVLVPIAHKEVVWMIPDGTHSATVSVSVERMR